MLSVLNQLDSPGHERRRGVIIDPYVADSVYGRLERKLCGNGSDWNRELFFTVGIDQGRSSLQFGRRILSRGQEKLSRVRRKLKCLRRAIAKPQFHYQCRRGQSNCGIRSERDGEQSPVFECVNSQLSLHRTSATDICLPRISDCFGTVCSPIASNARTGRAMLSFRESGIPRSETWQSLGLNGRETRSRKKIPESEFLRP